MTVTTMRPEPGQRRAEGPARIGPTVARDRSSERTELTVISIETIGVIGFLCAWMVSQMLLFGMLSHTRSQALLYAEFREQLAGATAPTGGVIVPGKPVSLITIPAIGIQEVVVEGTSGGELMKGPGHMRSSVLPGQVGASVVMGKARSYGAPFSNISYLRTGHAIHTTTAQGSATYRVDGVRRAGQPVPGDPPAGSGRLTLVSGFTGSRLDALAPHEVVYVDATLVSQSFQPPANAIRAVAPSELAMARDVAVLPSLALSMGGLALALSIALLVRGRIPDPLVWMIGTPIIIALAWASGDGLMHLLPNLF